MVHMLLTSYMLVLGVYVYVVTHYFPLNQPYIMIQLNTLYELVSVSDRQLDCVIGTKPCQSFDTHLIAMNLY